MSGFLEYPKGRVYTLPMQKKRIFVNILSGYVGKAIGIGLGIIIIPFLVHKLGKETFGIIIVVESIICLIELISTSVRTSIAHHTTFSLSQEKKKDFLEYLSTGRGILFVVALIVFSIGVLLSVNAPSFLHLPHSLSGQSRTLFMITTFSFAITIPNIVYWSVLYSHHRLDLINLTSSASQILRAASLLIFFSFLPPQFVSLTTYGVVYLLTTWSKNYFIYWWHKKILPDERIGLQHFNVRKVQEMVSYSVFSSLGQLSYILYENAMGMFLFFFWGASANAAYAISIKFPSSLERLFEEPTWSLTPTFTELYAKNSLELLRVLLFTYTKLVCLLVVPICLGIMFFSETLISLWMGNGFSVSAQILPLHILPLIVTVPFSVCYCVMSASAKVKIPGIIVGPSLVLMFALAVFFSRVVGLGIYGIAMGEATVHLLFAILFLPYYSCKIAKIRLDHYWKEAYLKPFAWAAGITLAGLAVFYAARMTLFSLKAQITALITLIVYATGSFMLILNPSEKGYLLGLFGGVKKRLRIFM